VCYNARHNVAVDDALHNPGEGTRLHLYEALAKRVCEWREQNHACADFPTIAEILEWATEPDGSGFRLRVPQLRALETYWYLRLIEGTPHVSELYQRYFPQDDPDEVLKAYGIPQEAFRKSKYNLADTLDRIRNDDEFASEYRLDALRETLTLDYASYILALAMGAGKTALIGAIIATEFAMSLEYPDGPFVQNALVFAPGKTIIESLRELAEIPYDRILPPRLYKPFSSSVKLTFTRDGDPDIQVVSASYFNIVVTNTEKIRIQKETIRKSDLGASLFASREKEEEARAEVANRRLQRIASLPHLAIFSDEAHHTYGQSLGTDLKKVRKTVDYLHEKSPNLVCVINTTGTPYFQKQPLRDRDVVIWYGLSQGIREGILKDVAQSIYAYSIGDTNVDQFVTQVLEQFFQRYGDVALPNGAPAKIALYFPQNDDLTKYRPVVEAKLMELGYPPTICLRNTSESPQSDIDAFNRLNDPASPHRVILLVNKGTEGWNCPSLFACVLVRTLRTSNNFVLQAALRCLRQVPGNVHNASIYLSSGNRSILDRQLQETYGESISDLRNARGNSRAATICVRKLNLPPLVVKQIVRSVVLQKRSAQPLTLTPPEIEADTLEMVRLEISQQTSTRKVLKQIEATVEIEAVPDTCDLYSAAVELAAVYRLDLWTVHDELRRVYQADELPTAHLGELAKQIEAQFCQYEVEEELVERALALVKLDGFTQGIDANGAEVYTAEISYPVSREHLLVSWQVWQSRTGEFGFHYTPYNFDSNPEKNFCEQLLEHLHLHPDQVQDLYFTGALTDPRKTDFYIEYKGEDDRWHRYTPDFIIRRKDGRCLIVEIKDTQFETATNEDLARDGRGERLITAEGRKAVALKKFAGLNPDRLKYEIIFAKDDTVTFEQTREAREFVECSD